MCRFNFDIVFKNFVTIFTYRTSPMFVTVVVLMNRNIYYSYHLTYKRITFNKNNIRAGG